MTIFEYMTSCSKDTVVTVEEDRSLYIENLDYDFYDYFHETDWLMDLGNGIFFIDKENVEKLCEINIQIFEDTNTDPFRERVYYRLRGCPVNDEQAFDIISRCDKYLQLNNEIRSSPLFVGCCHFAVNTMFDNCYPRCISFVAPDGRIGINSLSEKYPDISQFVYELFRYLYYFPYLNFVVAVAMGWFHEEDIENKKFYQYIDYGIHVHGKRIELVGKPETIRFYMEYEKQCGFPEECYRSHYYEDRKVFAAEPDYVRRCVERYDVDEDCFMNKV